MRRYKKGFAGFLAAAVLLQGSVPVMAQMPEASGGLAVRDLSGTAYKTTGQNVLWMPDLLSFSAIGEGKRIAETANSVHDEELEEAEEQDLATPSDAEDDKEKNREDEDEKEVEVEQENAGREKQTEDKGNTDQKLQEQSQNTQGLSQDTQGQSQNTQEQSQENEQNQNLENGLTTATWSNADRNLTASMPNVGTDAFTQWFFSNTEEEALWEWMFAVLEGEKTETYEEFLLWYEAHEDEIVQAYHKLSGIGLMSSSVGDLWENWNANMDFPGDGTRNAPYQIDSLSRLMGLSEAVAAGQDFSGQYFELTRDIDIGGLTVNSGSWNPIGWYQNYTELGGKVSHPFRGHFDGGGNTISGLKIVRPSLALTNIGLFGVIDGGTVKNLTIEAEDIVGEDNTAVLAGAVLGDAVIYGVTVSGYVNSKGNAGGIAGEVTGSERRVTIENCSSESIVLNSEGRDSYVGGIAGNVQNAWLVDNRVTTQDGDSNRIRGKGYVGGIAGRTSQADLYNSYVSGTIGGNGSRAAGGMIGKYQGGNLVLARMAGRISATNNGSASREGTFIGTRESRDRFTYGTEKDNHFSYLFTNDAAKAKNVSGSTIDGDNSFTKEAHIGYWTDNEKKYKIVAGRTETDSGERYFYEELEDAVRYIVTQKLNRQFTSADYAQGISFQIDHFAPGYMGEPVRGYLVSIPRIDAKNNNGTFDTDVAKLTAISATSNSYYRTIHKDHAAAIVPGSVVTVATAPKNTGDSRYQMVADANVPGGVKAPVFVDENGRWTRMDYVNGGSYSFIMPECDTELNVEYIKVTTRLNVDPAETSIHVTQTRSGDRKNPKIVTEVTNQEGTLIARYIDTAQDTSVQVQPVAIHGEHNEAGWTADRTMRWSVDDTNLLVNLSDAGYTVKDAVIMPNLDSAFIQGIINREVQAQADGQYQEKINNTIYTQNAVVTASTNPETSVDNRAVYANCRVKVTFQILDNTTVRVEDMNLNKEEVRFTVTRRLTGDRRNPQETIICSEPVILTAALRPIRPFFKNVSWKAKEDRKLISLTPLGDNTQDCRVEVNYDAEGKKNPAWIQNIILEDNERKKKDPYAKLDGKGTCTEQITAVSEDQTYGHVTASCAVRIDFVTVDETVIHPENISLNQQTLTYPLSYDYVTGIYSEIKSRNGFGEKEILQAEVLPELAQQEPYAPYNRKVEWISSDPDAVIVENGKIILLDHAGWIKEALKAYPYKAKKTVMITAKTKDNGLTAQCEINLEFQANAVHVSYTGGGSSGGGSGGGSGGKSSSSGSSGKSSIVGANTGSEAAGPGAAGPGAAGSEVVTLGIEGVPKSAVPEKGLPDYVVSGEWMKEETGGWRFSDGSRAYADEWAAVENPYADETAGQSPFDWFRFGQDGLLLSGWYKDSDGRFYYLNPQSDGTMGRMFSGWNWIKGTGGNIYCYYFNENSDGTRGALVCSGMTPDGYCVDASGRWIKDGSPQIR